MSKIFRYFLVVHARLQAKTVSFASSKCYSVECICALCDGDNQIMTGGAIIRICT